MPEPLSTGELALRIAAAAVLGGLIGLERELGDQPAGFRTHILSLGAALFTLAGAYGTLSFVPAEGAVRFDPTRVAAQVVTGIGFLGAGAILRQGLSIRGLTAAAALWVTAAIGVAVGLGYWAGATFSAAAALVSLWVLKRVETPLIRRLKRGRHRFVLEVDDRLRLSEFERLLESRGIRTEKLNLVAGEEEERRLIATLQLPSDVHEAEVVREMGELEGVRGVDLE